jgi:hypothetical protein
MEILGDGPIVMRSTAASHNSSGVSFGESEMPTMFGVPISCDKLLTKVICRIKTESVAVVGGGLDPCRWLATTTTKRRCRWQEAPDRGQK